MMRRRGRVRLVTLAIWLAAASALANESIPVQAAAQATAASSVEPANRPPRGAWRRLLLLEDYNTRVVLAGTTLLGCAAGMVGSFTLLRKRALMGDALSHASLPGICLAFILATALGGNGKSLPVLLLGATLSGLLGVGTILFIRNTSRLKEDTALGAVLSVFFGAGIALLGVIQQMQAGHAAGLEAFIYGKTASMSAADALLITAVGCVCIAGCALLFKELKLLCFDDGYAAARGMPVVALDWLLMGLVTTVTIVGLQAVGLILVVALLVIPAAAARFWTENMTRMVVYAGLLGAASGLVGAAASAVFANLPSGAMIVLVCTGFFLLSMLLGVPRGVLPRWVRRVQLSRGIDRQHLLRAMYEMLELSGHNTSEGFKTPLPLENLLAVRSWSPRGLQRTIRRARHAWLVAPAGAGIRFTAEGWEQARRLTRQHRLWELYLIAYADTAPSRVDQDADEIEHVLDPEVVAELEALLRKSHPEVPKSPHDLELPAPTTPGAR